MTPVIKTVGLSRNYVVGTEALHADGPRGHGMRAARVFIAAAIAIAACAALAGSAQAASPDSTAAAQADGLWVVASDSTARPISLSEALELAQRNSPQAVQARGQTRTAAAGSRSAVAAFIPNVSVSAGATRQDA